MYVCIVIYCLGPYVLCVTDQVFSNTLNGRMLHFASTDTLRRLLDSYSGDRDVKG
jgi:hypothetical protein